MMHAQMRVAEEPEQTEAEAIEVVATQLAHSLLAVLMPANPPQPKNARIIRLFDYEAAKNDPQPAMAVETPKQEPTPREAAKAARKLSLFVAAGLV
jgi:hypothetical protein